MAKTSKPSNRTLLLLLLLFALTLLVLSVVVVVGVMVRYFAGESVGVDGKQEVRQCMYVCVCVIRIWMDSSIYT